MTIKKQAVSDAMIEKVWADFVNCQDDRYFGNKTKRGHQLAVLRRFADSILASHPLEQHTIVLGQSCPPHMWAHSPTVGCFDCVKCREHVNYDDPRYAGLLADREGGKHALEQQQAVSDD